MCTCSLHTCVHAETCIHTHTHAHTRIDTDIRTYIHTYIHAYDTQVLGDLERKMADAQAKAAQHKVADEALQLAIDQVAQGDLVEARHALELAKKAYKVRPALRLCTPPWTPLLHA